MTLPCRSAINIPEYWASLEKVWLVPKKEIVDGDEENHP